MVKKQRHCTSCGSDDRCHKDMETGLWLCIECETNEWYGGFPVLNEEPHECPLCGGDIMTGLCGHEEHDETLDEYLPDPFDERKVYIFESAGECDNLDCPLSLYQGGSIGYGRRWYFNPDSGQYDLDKPLFGIEALRAELKAQEAAGQKRLPGID